MTSYELKNLIGNIFGYDFVGTGQNLRIEIRLPRHMKNELIKSFVDEIESCGWTVPESLTSLSSHTFQWFGITADFVIVESGDEFTIKKIEE